MMVLYKKLNNLIFMEGGPSKTIITRPSLKPNSSFEGRIFLQDFTALFSWSGRSLY